MVLEQEKLSLSKYYDKYKDWLLQRAYLENNSTTLNVDSEIDNFIKGLVYEKQYFKLTRDDRNSRERSIRAKYSQGQILVTLQSFDRLIDKLPALPSPMAPRYSGTPKAAASPMRAPIGRTHSKFSGKSPRFGISPHRINQLISSDYDYDPANPTAVVDMPDDLTTDEISYAQKFCHAISSLPNDDETQFCVMINQMTENQYDTSKPCAVCSKPGHNFDSCPILNDTKFLKTAWIKVKMFFSKLQRFQADAIDAKISQINAQAIEAGFEDHPADTIEEQMDFQ